MLGSAHEVVMRRRGNFLVNHFAGAVEYESRDFLFKQLAGTSCPEP